MKTERIIDGYYFDSSLGEKERKHILKSALFFLEGVRDLDLVASPIFLKRVFEELNTEAPIIYLKPDQMALISQKNPIRQNLNKIAAISKDKEKQGKAKKVLRKVSLFRDIVRQSLSVIDIGLIRRIDVFPCDPLKPQNKNGDGLSLRIVYCLTTDECPHTAVMKYAIARACIDTYNHLKNPKNKNAIKIPKLVDAEVFLEPGDPWKLSDMDERILEILGGSENIEMPYQNNKKKFSKAKGSLNIIN